MFFASFDSEFAGVLRCNTIGGNRAPNFKWEWHCERVSERVSERVPGDL